MNTFAAEVALQKEFFNRLNILVISVIIPSIVGWFIPSIVKWSNSYRKQLEKYILKIDLIFDEQKNLNEKLIQDIDSLILCVQ